MSTLTAHKTTVIGFKKNIYLLKWVVLYGGKKRVPGLHLKIKFGSFYDRN